MSATTEKYTEAQIKGMQQVILSGKANQFQTSKYNMICESLRAEIAALLPDSKPSLWARKHAVYLYNAVIAIEWDKNRHERKLSRQAIANAHTAHQQLKNFPDRIKE